MLGVRRGWGGEEGEGVPRLQAVNPAPARGRELRVPGRREAAAPEDEDRRDAPALPALLPSLPAAGTGVSMRSAGDL